MCQSSFNTDARDVFPAKLAPDDTHVTHTHTHTSCQPVEDNGRREVITPHADPWRTAVSQALCEQIQLELRGTLLRHEH